MISLLYLYNIVRTPLSGDLKNAASFVSARFDLNAMEALYLFFEDGLHQSVLFDHRHPAEGFA